MHNKEGNMERNLGKNGTLDGRLDNVTLEIYRLYFGEARADSELEKRLTLTWQDD